MGRNTVRLGVSLLVSVACALLTHLWYQSANTLSLDYGDQRPIAQLVDVVNEVQKKPQKRLVWRGLSNNESLYAGEMVRTTEGSQARILFPATGTQIDLEPDSLIVINEDNDGLSLEFLKGFLQVKGGTNDKLKLKSGNNTISVAGSELSLGRAQTGTVQLQVFKGEPQIQGSDFQRVKDSFKILRPAPNAQVHVSPSGSDPVVFQWQPLNEPHDLVLEAGKSRSEMKAVDITPRDESGLQANLAPGDYYWRLVAKPREGKGTPLVSSVYRLRVLPKRPPVALNPSADSTLTQPGAEQKITLRWANPGQLVDIVAELAESVDLKANPQIIKSAGADLLEVNLKNNATYYWRLTGYLAEKREPVSGPVQKFRLQQPSEFSPPNLLAPALNASFSFSEVAKQGVSFRWQSASGAESYQLRIKSLSGSPNEQLVPIAPSPLTQAVVRDLTPGEYEWSVTSFDRELKALKATAPRRLKVAELSKLEWLNGEEETLQYFYSTPPELEAGWKPGPKETVSYRFTWREAKPEAPAQTAEAKNTQFKTAVAGEGRYHASVEALNADGLVIAKSPEKAFQLKPAPLLDAPRLAEQLPDPLKAGRNGRLDLTWTTISGAQEYVIEVKGKDGALVREERVNSSQHTLTKLMPGDYTVSVRGVDQGGRRGIASTARPVVVPAVSDVSAPTMKKIKVE